MRCGPLTAAGLQREDDTNGTSRRAHLCDGLWLGKVADGGCPMTRIGKSARVVRRSSIWVNNLPKGVLLRRSLGPVPVRVGASAAYRGTPLRDCPLPTGGRTVGRTCRASRGHPLHRTPCLQGTSAVLLARIRRPTWRPWASACAASTVHISSWCDE